ncbi:MAG: D-tyrosyl-tRNA(Tyr) deacylase [Gammaproteobacteria bacterium]|jgi:D-tyrosyl-tRNA(Tyr) deacylase|nr:D-tyrosyl-tRNA(Tyr) deacylase [Gammaproteobacteria bacterium]MBT3472412.1 D-tyrosyl-tRNA(Tyr) deacylase [Gammaproteobacteria bacterium]MBT4607804.1 D-tyrosyl-tRNA(Tyr) deacylase [Thiotrichales bacterium]MBT6671040.1 D-tyrosyl-tRNA(Tyr) deacylase [Gammaproteobacteria bacterium]MBT8006007.1 D-tyrosyl-tRNA(Tyr) deacylase [Gammaproteobacteria bacterium]
MIGLLQRVTSAEVTINRTSVGRIDAGLLVLVGVEPEDSEATLKRLLQRILGYRIFSDMDDKMNLSLQQVNGGLLLVPQFTLAADTQKGMRPGFSTAAEPALGEQLFHRLVERARELHPLVESGQFGADMQVALVNDGPATFLLRS